MMKRFYSYAAAAPVEGGFGVTLDGKPVRTPAGAILTAATPALADALAAEWAEQTGEVRPLAMPLNRLALTQQDRVSPRREAVITEALAYVESDLLCYRTGDDATLAARQIAAWNPLLDWFSAAYGVTLTITEGLMPVTQDRGPLAPLRLRLEGFTDADLTAFALLTPMAGSFVLALALLDGRLSAEATYHLSQLDESYQIEKWGEDDEAAERRAALALEFQDIARFLALNRA
jgi:chaperone required for assembly of F1-ATPase